MDSQVGSRTAIAAARYRAIHQVVDGGKVFADPVAVPILGMSEHELVAADRDEPARRPMRMFVALRHAYAQGVVREAAARGVDQVVVLGAGLDTTAYRPDSADLGVTVYEVDLSTSQAWKRERLAQADIEPVVPVRYVGVDLSTGSLNDALADAGFALSHGAVALWLGVLPYLERDAIRATLTAISRWGKAAVVFDYAEPPAADDSPTAQWRQQQAARVAQLGEPWRTYLGQDECRELLRELGFTDIEDMGLAEFGPRYLGMTGDIPDRPGGHVVSAWRAPAQDGPADPSQ